MSASGRGRYSNVLHEMWEDTPVRELSADAKLLFVWSFTNGPCASLTGLTAVSPRKLRRVLQETPELADERRVESALEELARKPLIAYDWDHELLWCINRAEHANTSPKVEIAIRNWFGSIKIPSPLLTKFARRYKALLDGTLEREPVQSPQQVARKKVYEAVKSGKLVRGPCDMESDDCSGRIEGHHDDYSKPLDVRWLCAHHHRQVDRDAA